MENENDPQIRILARKAKAAKSYYRQVVTGSYDDIFRFKSRAVNPWVKLSNILHQLTQINPPYKKIFNKVKKSAIKGWKIIYISPK